MKYMIMVNHGGFAPGLHSAIKMVTGGCNDVLSISLKADISADEFVANFRTLVELLNTDDSVILLAGIPSGSLFTNTLTVLDEKGLMPNTLMVAGMSVLLAITAVSMKDNFNNAELLKETLLNEGHAGLAEFKVEDGDTEDDI